MTALPESAVVGVVGAGTMGGRDCPGRGGGRSHRAAARRHRRCRRDRDRADRRRARPAGRQGAYGGRRTPGYRRPDQAVGGARCARPRGAGHRGDRRGPGRQAGPVRGPGGHRREAAILATNTSTLSVTAIAADLERAERLVGMHFFNPAPVMALVEVVSGLATDRAAAEAVFETARRWGKQPVHARSTPGFIVNRVARPFYGEALRLLSQGRPTPRPSMP